MFSCLNWDIKAQFGIRLNSREGKQDKYSINSQQMKLTLRDVQIFNIFQFTLNILQNICCWSKIWLQGLGDIWLPLEISNLEKSYSQVNIFYTALEIFFHTAVKSNFLYQCLASLYCMLHIAMFSQIENKKIIVFNYIKKICKKWLSGN